MSKIHYLVPARKGSKGFPLKNRKLFEHFVKQVPENMRGDVCVSTDDEYLMDRCEKLGFCHMRRNKPTAGDRASMKAVVQEFAKKKRVGYNDIIVILYLTYPERIWRDVERAISLFNDKKTKSLLCRKEVKTHPYLCMVEKNGGKGQQIVPHDLYRRQDYPKCFEISHFISILRFNELNKLGNNLYNKNTMYMEIEDVVDVDYSEDLQKVDVDKIDRTNTSTGAIKDHALCLIANNDNITELSNILKKYEGDRQIVILHGGGCMSMLPDDRMEHLRNIRSDIIFTNVPRDMYDKIKKNQKVNNDPDYLVCEIFNMQQYKSVLYVSEYRFIEMLDGASDSEEPDVLATHRLDAILVRQNNRTQRFYKYVFDYIQQYKTWAKHVNRLEALNKFLVNQIPLLKVVRSGVKNAPVEIANKIKGLPTHVDLYIERIRKDLANGVSIIGNGNSLLDLSHAEVNELNALPLFRCNWFFQDNQSGVSNDVYAWFFMLDQNKIFDKFTKSKATTNYVFTPKKNLSCDKKVKIIDYWPLMHEYNNFFERCLKTKGERRVSNLPTIGVQMLAMSAIIKPKRILLAGFDLYTKILNNRVKMVGYTSSNDNPYTDISYGHDIETDMRLIIYFAKNTKYSYVKVLKNDLLEEILNHVWKNSDRSDETLIKDCMKIYKK